MPLSKLLEPLHSGTKLDDVIVAVTGEAAAELSGVVTGDDETIIVLVALNY